MPTLVSSCSADVLSHAAKTGMTADTVPKIIGEPINHETPTARIVGLASESGMIHPNMATMIAVRMTDALIDPNELDTILRVTGLLPDIGVVGRHRPPIRAKSVGHRREAACV